MYLDKSHSYREFLKHVRLLNFITPFSRLFQAATTLSVKKCLLTLLTYFFSFKGEQGDKRLCQCVYLCMFVSTVTQKPLDISSPNVAGGYP